MFTFLCPGFHPIALFLKTISQGPFPNNAVNQQNHISGLINFGVNWTEFLVDRGKWFKLYLNGSIITTAECDRQDTTVYSVIKPETGGNVLYPIDTAL